MDEPGNGAMWDVDVDGDAKNGKRFRFLALEVGGSSGVGATRKEQVAFFFLAQISGVGRIGRQAGGNLSLATHRLLHRSLFIVIDIDLFSLFSLISGAYHRQNPERV